MVVSGKTSTFLLLFRGRRWRRRRGYFFLRLCLDRRRRGRWRWRRGRSLNLRWWRRRISLHLLLKTSASTQRYPDESNQYQQCNRSFLHSRYTFRYFILLISSNVMCRLGKTILSPVFLPKKHFGFSFIIQISQIGLILSTTKISFRLPSH